MDAPPGPKYAGLERAAGQRIEAVGRRGKFLLLPLSAGDELVVHLGMTGVLTPREPERHERARLVLDGGPDPVLHFRDPRRFGRFLVVPAGDYASLPTLAAMGPEPLSEAFTVEGFARALRGSRVAVKTFLLSQKPVAGVGNIYADEALWRAGVHPRTAARRVARRRIGPLRDAIREVLQESIEAQGTTLSDYRRVNGESGGFLERLAVYGRDEQGCRRCGSQIEKISLGGRGTHYCPQCQKKR